MKAIKKPSSQLPIEPTQKPKPEELLKVSTAVVNLAQSCLLSPSAVIAALRCSLDLYAQNALNRGFDVGTVQECEKLGQALAKAFMDAGGVKAPVAATPGLVDASGMPMKAED